MSGDPYSTQPPYAFWRRSVSEVEAGEVDPVVRPAFIIEPKEPVATAGSCFAQHIGRYLRRHGFNYYVTERAHPIVAPQIAQSYGYDSFTARYGNIYTSRQLLQLLQRAYGEFQPEDDIWIGERGFVDPFRPQIQPGGFGNREEYDADRRQHFARVREAIEGMGVLVFTLGLTECWRSKVDGAVYPLCPGVAGGTFDPAVHEFVNLTVDDVRAEMIDAIDRIRKVNPGVKVVLTVSPVPLVATALDRHVLVSTTYSKSVLRVAAEQVAAARPQVAYFPSYEIVTGNFSRGRYFGPDLRSVTEEGVGHVMRLFLKHYLGADIGRGDEEPSRGPRDEAPDDAEFAAMAELVEAACDEEALDRR